MNVQLRHDPALGVTVVHAHSDLGDAQGARQVTQVLETLLARCCTHELLAASSDP